MNRNNIGANANLIQIITDMFAIFLALVISIIIDILNFNIGIGKLLLMAFIFAMVIYFSNKESHLYNVTLFYYTDRFFRILTRSWINAFVITVVVLFAADATYGTKFSFYWFAGLSYFFLLVDMVLSRFFQRMSSTKNAPRTVLVGHFEDYQKFNYFLNKTSIKINPLGYVLVDGEEQTDYQGVYKVLGTLENLENIIKENNVDQVYFMQYAGMNHEAFHNSIDLCIRMGTTAKVVVNSYLPLQSSSYVSAVGTYPVITYHTITLNAYALFFKRIFDIVISIVSIIIASPIMLFTSIAIALDSKGPVVFKQTRVGQNGREFQIYKFRSMVENAEELRSQLEDQNEVADGMMFKIKDDPRITKVGAFIRKTSIDELPQLFNVLFGDMSLVGTRPPTLDEVEKYNSSQWRRISIKPGITGMWQVHGRSNVVDFEEVVRLDLEYIDNWSLFLDIKLLFQTVYSLLGGKGAY